VKPSPREERAGPLAAVAPAVAPGGPPPGSPPCPQPAPGARLGLPLRRQVRWWILGLLFCVTVINFIDRQTLSVTAPKLREIFRLSNTQYGVIVSAFQLGMVAGEFPMGWLMDRVGARLGLTVAVLWWSVANALHATAGSLAQFAGFRFWLGTGECGNFSGGNKVVAQWFPVRERAFAVGIFNSASMIGTAVAPFLVVPIMQRFGWRAAFLVPSLLGMAWVAAWYVFYRAPEDHARLTAAEAAYIREDRPPGRGAPAPRNAELLRLPETWGLMICRLLVGPVVQFYIYWLPEYLYRVRGVSLTEYVFFAWVPFLFGDLGSIGGGWASGYLIRRGFSVRQARIITMGLGAALCFLSLAVVLVKTVPVALVAICFVLFGHTALSANMFAAVSDTFPSTAVARVTGLTGIAGGLSGMLFPLLTGVLVDRISYTPVFAMASLMPAVGLLVLVALAGRFQQVTLRAS
jgi:ACS family hexuronate transporter-like MFS transporter